MSLTSEQLLSDTLLAAGIPVNQITNTGGVFTVTYTRELTAPEASTANGIIASFSASDSRKLVLRTLAKEAIEKKSEFAVRLIVAVALVVMDENNILRTWLRDFKTQTAAATSLADFKTRVATLATLADRTIAQAKTAVKNKLDTGDADTTEEEGPG